MVRHMKAELLIDVSTTLGECPRWSVTEQRLFLLDIEEQALICADPLNPETVRRTRLDSRVSAFTESAQGPWMATAGSGFGWLDPATGKVTNVVSVVDPTSAQMNDGATDPQGRFWAGSASVDTARRDGSLFMLDAGLNVHTMLTSVGMSNGLGWLQDGQLFLHVDSLARTVTSYEVVDEDTGTSLTNPRVVVALSDSEGLPDGLAVDESGAFWLAVWGPGEVRRYTLEGELDTIVETGAALTTSCAFGGPRLNTLYVASAMSSPVSGPNDGGLFSVVPGVSGAEPHQFRSSLGLKPSVRP